MKRMGLPLEKRDRHYTYAGYRTWPDDERWELIEAAAYNMSPAPGTTHQKIGMFLSYRISAYLEGKPCRVFHAPFDVFLPDPEVADENDIDTIVQPDIVVIRDRAKIRERGCFGAPDFVIEILSPYTSRKDQREKFDLYQKHGVREYRIVDPHARNIQAYRLDGSGQYGEMELVQIMEPGRWQKTQSAPATIRSHVLEELELERMFA
jgi:Uma2 family endonuclease